MYKQQYPHLFTPLKIRDLIVKNRIMSAPNMMFRTIGGRPDDYYIRYLEHKARGGAGIVTLGEANVCDGGNHTPGMETTLENLAIYAEMSRVIHEHGAAANVELTHGGMRAKPQFNHDPSLIMGPSELDNPMTGAHVKAMTEADMEYVANGFADTAAYYFHAGFDTVLLHCAHSWLLTQFMSPLVNQRTDEYGGSLENRLRFPLYVLKKVRERIGPDRALTIRLSGSERHPDGFTTQDMIKFLEKAQEFIDMAEISTENMPWQFTTPYVPRGQNVPMAEEIKKSGSIFIPIYAHGAILEPEQAEEIIASGKADGVSMSRALIADPYLPKKAAAGRPGNITPCLRCLNCTDNDNLNRHFVCSVNPLTGHELRLGFGDSVETAADRKKVLIVGGGPAGMQAAITAAALGHTVTLVERGPVLGGLLRFTETDSFKHELRRFREYLVRQTGKSSAKILLNTAVTDELVDSIDPDGIIIATGSEPVVPPIPGVESARHATDIYFDPGFDMGERVVIIGGGLVGLEAGLHLSNLGKRVTVLELCEEVARDAKWVYRAGLMHAVDESGMEIVTLANTKEISASGVTYENGGKTVSAAADTILYATGMRPVNAAYFALYGKAPSVALIGDAKKPGKVDGAMSGGYFAALDL